MQLALGGPAEKQNTHPRPRYGSCSAEGTNHNARLPSTARLLPLCRHCWHPSPTLPTLGKEGKKQDKTWGGSPAPHDVAQPRGSNVQPLPRVLSRTSVSPRGHHPAVRAPPPGRCDSSIRSLLSSLPHLPPSLEIYILFFQP